MSNSSLVTYKNLTSKHNTRTQKITKITIHHMCAVWSGKECADYFCKTSRQVSANYCIGNGGDIAQNVLEEYRAWTSSSSWNDQRAVTIEVSNSKLSGDYPVSDAAMRSLIALCVDICKRNGIKRLYFDGTKNASLTWHCFYSNTDCPGAYLKKMTSYICTEVNKQLGIAPTVSTSNPYKKPTMILNANNAAYKRGRYAGRSEVKWIHYELHRLGYYNGAIDGYFGPLTVAAVKAFQRDHKDVNGRQLDDDGSVGQLTREALARAQK